VHARIRADVPVYDADRYLAPELEAAWRIVLSGDLDHVAADLLPSLGPG
jgi:histidine ammonia-lyase